MNEQRRLIDPHLATLMASTARVEAGVVNLNEKVDDLKEVTVKRLDDHAAGIRSLELTRSRQRGGAGVLAAVTTMAGSFIAFWRP